jgi:hypothetical protein
VPSIVFVASSSSSLHRPLSLQQPKTIPSDFLKRKYLLPIVMFNNSVWCWKLLTTFFFLVFLRFCEPLSYACTYKLRPVSRQTGMKNKVKRSKSRKAFILSLYRRRWWWCLSTHKVWCCRVSLLTWCTVAIWLIVEHLCDDIVFRLLFKLLTLLFALPLCCCMAGPILSS